MSRESSERNMWSPASYDTLHMSAGRPAYASDRSCSKQKREEKTTNTNSISWRRRGRCWRRRNRNTTTCEDRAGYRRTQQEMEREREAKTVFVFMIFSISLLILVWLGCTRRVYRSRFLSFFFVAFFVFSLLLCASEPNRSRPTICTMIDGGEWAFLLRSIQSSCGTSRRQLSLRVSLA